MSRYFTNMRTFKTQDLNDLSEERTYHPNEYWIVWPDGSTGQPEAGEAGWRETTVEEFETFNDDPNIVTHVISATDTIHNRPKCDYCFEHIPPGEEHRFVDRGVDYVWHKVCMRKMTEEMQSE